MGREGAFPAIIFEPRTTAIQIYFQEDLSPNIYLNNIYNIFPGGFISKYIFFNIIKQDIYI